MFSLYLTLLGSIGALSMETASAALWRHIDVENASINNSSWNLTDNNRTYTHIDKNGQEQKPVRVTSIKYKGSRSLRLWTKDEGLDVSYKTDKSEYLVMPHSNSYAVRFPDDSNFRGDYYGGFAFRLDKNYFDSIKTSLLFGQCWQDAKDGRGPALSIEFNKNNGNGNQKLRIKVRDDWRNNKVGGARSVGIRPTIRENRWYTLIQRLRPSYRGDGSYGRLSVWLEDTSNGNETTVADEGRSGSGNSFEWGFLPSGKSATVSGVKKKGKAARGMSFAFAIYRRQQDRDHRMFFDQVKYGNSSSSVQP